MNRRLAVLRSVTIVSLSTYIEFALGLLVSVWIARALGPSEFGRYAVTVWLCGWLIVCSNNALTTSSIKFIAEAHGAGAPGIASHIAYRLSQLQHCSSFIVIALFVLVTYIVQPAEWHPFLLPETILVVIAVVAKANYSMSVAIEKGQERFEPEAIAKVITSCIGIALVTGAAMAHAGMLQFVAIFAAASLTLNLINRIAYRRYCVPVTAGAIPPTTEKRLYRHLRLTAALVLLGSLRGGTIEIFLLNACATTVAVGFFAIATTLTRGAVQLLSVGLTTTLLTYMAKSFGQHGERHAAQLLSETTRFYWAVGVAIAGLGLVTTPGMVAVMYGDRYAGAIPAIETILVMSGLMLVLNGISAFQTVVDRQHDRVRITGITLCSNAILGILLIPRFALTGAVMTYAGTRVAELALSIFYLQRATTTSLPLDPMMRLLGAGMIATALAWLTTTATSSPYGFIPGSAVFILIYVPASVLVHYWTAQDFQLMAVLTSRLGPPGRLLMRSLNGLQNLRINAPF